MKLLPRCLLVFAFISLALSGELPAQEKKAPKWPHVNVATAYIIDPAWPQRPADFKWAEMPGVTVDAKDNVYIYTRSTPPVQVYDSSGKFVRAWGQDTIKTKAAHHIKIDHEGNVWIADIEDHVVQKYTPEGKLL